MVNVALVDTNFSSSQEMFILIVNYCQFIPNLSTALAL